MTIKDVFEIRNKQDKISEKLKKGGVEYLDGYADGFSMGLEVMAYEIRDFLMKEEVNSSVCIKNDI